jgi:hypothetical protein
VTDHSGNGVIGYEFLSDFSGCRTIAIIVARNEANVVAIDTARFVDFLDGELDALQVLLPVTLLPGTCSADDVRLLVGGAAREH